MKSIYIKKVVFFLIICGIFYCSIGDNTVFAAKPKTIMIILDELDKQQIKKLASNKCAVGLINNRTASLYKSDEEESYFMTLACGRRIRISDGLYKGVRKLHNGKLQVIEYQEILNDLKQNFSYFSQEKILGQCLSENEVSIGYIGEGSAALIAANNKGIINYGENHIIYKEQWLSKQTEKIMKDADLLIVSYNLRGKENRVDILNNYINEFSEVNFIVISLYMNAGLSININSGLSPVIYKTPHQSEGLLTTNTTKRIGIITNLDILPQLASMYGLDNTHYIGNIFEIQSNPYPTKAIEKDFIKYQNLNIIRYILYSIVIAAELFVIISWLISKKKNICRYQVIMNSIIMSIFLSFIMSIFIFYRSIIAYCFVLVIFSILLAVKIPKKISNQKFNLIQLVSAATYILIIFGSFFNEDIVYDSYIGFNNLFAGGRFYGLNNGIMGVFLATSVIFCYTISRLTRNKKLGMILYLLVPSLNLIVLSGRYGANAGGYLTATVLFLLIVYYEIFEKRFNKLRMIPIIFLGVIILMVNFYVDIKGINGSHTGDFIIRVNEFGFAELINMIEAKIKQLIFMLLMSPWGIIIISQSFLIIRLYKKIFLKITENDDIHIFKEINIIFIVSLVGLLLNDTGVIAFTYMNTYVIAMAASLHNTERRGLC